MKGEERQSQLHHPLPLVLSRVPFSLPLQWDNGIIPALEEPFCSSLMLGSQGGLTVSQAGPGTKDNVFRVSTVWFCHTHAAKRAQQEFGAFQDPEIPSSQRV